MCQIGIICIVLGFSYLQVGQHKGVVIAGKKDLFNQFNVEEDYYKDY